MLIAKRKRQQFVEFTVPACRTEKTIRVHVEKILENNVVLGCEADDDVRILRGELLEGGHPACPIGTEHV